MWLSNGQLAFGVTDRITSQYHNLMRKRESEATEESFQR
jgi:hypothetical protein